MDEGRKCVLWICASMLAAAKLSAIEDGKQDAQQTQITYDAILKAERIINRIDAHYPANPIPGKT
jgi:hypothetical protein